MTRGELRELLEGLAGLPYAGEPVDQHAEAKRYLVTTDSSYRDLLSPASVSSLEDQGGAMTSRRSRRSPPTPGRRTPFGSAAGTTPPRRRARPRRRSTTCSRSTSGRLDKGEASLAPTGVRVGDEGEGRLAPTIK
jgi:hypothetical protein